MMQEQDTTKARGAAPRISLNSRSVVRPPGGWRGNKCTYGTASTDVTYPMTSGTASLAGLNPMKGIDRDR